MPFNFFKRQKKEEPKQKALEPVVEKQEQQREQEQAPKAASAIKKKAKRASSLPSVLFNPHITEKATLLGERGQYVFRVHPKATKGAVKQSVESLYGVEVREVRLTKKPARKIRIGRKEGKKPGLKKAVVQLKAGQRIEVISR